MRQHLTSDSLTERNNTKKINKKSNNHNNNRMKHHQGQMTNKHPSLLKMRADREYNNRPGWGGVCQKKPTGNCRLIPQRFPDANSAL